MDSETGGLIGGIVGGTLGVLGGVIGTYFSIKNTNGPRERALMIRASAVAWVVVLMFLVALGLTPLRYQVWLWLPYVLLLALAIRAGNRKHEQIRREESGDAAPRPGIKRPDESIG